MNGSRLFDVLSSLVVVLLVTTLILPGRQTTGVIRASGRAGSDLFRAASGQR